MERNSTSVVLLGRSCEVVESPSVSLLLLPLPLLSSAVAVSGGVM
jgi:hypothetical protein